MKEKRIETITKTNTTNTTNSTNTTKSKTLNMTVGNPLRNLVIFALPLMLGNVFQQCYTLTDTWFVGRFVGLQGLAAFGIVEWPMCLFYCAVIGLTQGFSVMVAQRFGAGDKNGMKKAIGNTFVLSGFIALGLVILGQVLIRPTIGWMGTPEAIRGISESYLRILYAAAPIAMSYNCISAVLRAMGNSKTPLQAMGIASFVNIALDFTFVFLFEWGIIGAAIATIIAQLISALFCLRVLCKMQEASLTKSDFKLEWTLSRKLLALGLPIGAQGVLLSVGGMFMQSIVNSFGTVFLAGYTASNKLYGIMEIAASALGFAMTTFVSQNYGAREFKRIRSGLKMGVLLAGGISLFLGLGMFFFGELFLGLFINGEGQDVAAAMDYGFTYLRFMGLGMPIICFLYIYRAATQGMGESLTTLVSGIVEMICRPGFAFLLMGMIAEYAIYTAEVGAWFFGFIAAFIGMMIHFKRLNKRERTMGNNAATASKSR